MLISLLILNHLPLLIVSKYMNIEEINHQRKKKSLKNLFMHGKY